MSTAPHQDARVESVLSDLADAVASEVVDKGLAIISIKMPGLNAMGTAVLSEAFESAFRHGLGLLVATGLVIVKTTGEVHLVIHDGAPPKV